MQLYEPIYNGGIIDEVLRICGVTNAVYSNKSIIARVNMALDRYWKLASDAALKASFDDENQTSAPIETQNLVSGTNSYKVSSFTSNILQFLRLSVLDSGGTETDLVYEEFDSIEEFNYKYSTDITGLPNRWTKIGDYIYLYPCPDFSKTSGLRAYVNRELVKFTFKTISSINTTSNVITASTVHGLVAGDAVIFETDGTAPTGLTADLTVYYVIAEGFTTLNFEVSTIIGGSTVDITNAQTTSNHKFIKVNAEPGIPVIHHDYLARHAALPFLIEKNLPQAGAIAQLIAQEELAILEFWQNTNRETKTIIRTAKRCYK